VEDAEFDLVLANVNTGKTPLKQPKPYVVKEVGGVKVGFLGLVTNYANGHPDGDDPVYVGTEFFSPEWTAEKYGRKLRERCDVMVVISHCGLDRDTTNVASAFPYADLIISGHTHETYSGSAGDVAVVQGTNKLKAVGVTTIKVVDGEVTSLESRYLSLPKEGDEQMEAGLADYYNNPFLTEPIGTLTATATKTALAQMMADEGRRVAGTDLGFYHIGGTRLHSLEAGDVTRADIYELEPFQSYLAVTTMTLEEIKQMIINKFNDTTNYKESHRRDLIPSGMSYTIVTNPATGDAVDIRFDIPRRKELYTVAMSNYVYENKTYPYTRRAEDGRTPLVTRYLFDRLAEGPYTPDLKERVFVK
jgi:2',3'-cyclic-nucleotide 2'-phosphodiesterase (5'-nucleotidase family)